MENNRNRGPTQENATAAARRKSRANNLPPAFDEAVVQGPGVVEGRRRSSVGPPPPNGADPPSGRRSSIVKEGNPPLSARSGNPPLSARSGGERRSSTGAPPPGGGGGGGGGGGSSGGGGGGPNPAATKASKNAAATTAAKQAPVQASEQLKKQGGKKNGGEGADKDGKAAAPPPGCCGRRCATWWHTLYMSFVNCMVTMPCYSFDVYKYSAEVARYQPLFESLGLHEREVGVFYIFYNRIDIDRSNSITIHELLDFLGVERTDFSHRVFSIFDEDGNGTVDFREFVTAMWNYSTLNLASLVLFAFDLYDKDGSGELELAEIKKMLIEVYGEGYANNVHARQIVLDLHDKMGVALGMPVFMKVTDFSEFCHQHPAMLMPAFTFQDALRSRICGPSFWDRCTSKRLQLSNGQYVSIGTLMQAAVNEDVARGVMAADRIGKNHQQLTSHRESEAVGFIKNIGGNLASRRRGSNDLAQDKVRDALARATKAREEAAKQHDDPPASARKRRQSGGQPPASSGQQAAASPAQRQSGAGKNEAKVLPMPQQANVQSLGQQADKLRDEHQRGRQKKNA